SVGRRPLSRGRRLHAPECREKRSRCRGQSGRPLRTRRRQDLRPDRHPPRVRRVRIDSPRGARIPGAGRRIADLHPFGRPDGGLRDAPPGAIPIPPASRDARRARRPRGMLPSKLSGDEAMKWLVVTADELGLSTKRNQGIVDAHCKGIVTSASMLAYGPAFREAVKIAKALPALDIGLHLNLSEGEPLVLGHKTLV